MLHPIPPPLSLLTLKLPPLLLMPMPAEFMKLLLHSLQLLLSMYQAPLQHQLMLRRPILPLPLLLLLVLSLIFFGRPMLQPLLQLQLPPSLPSLYVLLTAEPLTLPMPNYLLLISYAL